MKFGIGLFIPNPWRVADGVEGSLNAGHVTCEITACWSMDWVSGQSDVLDWFKIVEFCLLWKFLFCCGKSIVVPIHWSLSLFIHSLGSSKMASRCFSHVTFLFLMSWQFLVILVSWCMLSLQVLWLLFLLRMLLFLHNTTW